MLSPSDCFFNLIVLKHQYPSYIIQCAKIFQVVWLEHRIEVFKGRSLVLPFIHIFKEKERQFTMLHLEAKAVHEKQQLQKALSDI